MTFRLLTLFLSLIGTAVVAQNVQLLSASTNEAIPYANLVYYQGDTVVGGTYSSKEGIASSECPLTANRIELSHLNYHTRLLDISAIRDTIYLEEKTQMLAETTILPRTESEISYLGTDRKLRTVGLSSSKGIEVISLISNPQTDARRIKAFVFHLKRAKEKTMPTIRVVFYANQKGRPGEQPIGETVLTLSPNSRGKIEIDLSKKGLRLPAEGIFAGVEWLGCDGQELSFEDQFYLNCHRRMVCNFHKSGQPPFPSFIRARFTNSHWQNLCAGIEANYTPVFGLQVY